MKWMVFWRHFQLSPIPWQMWSHLFFALMYFTNKIKCSTFNEECLFSQNIMNKTKLSEITLNFDQSKLSCWALFIFYFFIRVKWTIFLLKTGHFIQVFIPALIFCFQITCFHEPCYVSKPWSASKINRKT